MPRRVYGSMGVNSGNKRIRVAPPEPIPSGESQIKVEQSEEKKKSNFSLYQAMGKYKKQILITIISVLCLCTLSFSLWVFVFDSGYGGSSAEEISDVYCEALIHKSDNIWKCVPQAVRDKKFASSDTVWTHTPLFENYVFRDFDIKSESSRSLSSTIDVLEKNFSEFYDSDISMDDAVAVTYTGTLYYAENNSDNQSDVTFDIICFKHGVRWYVYTAGITGLSNINTPPDTSGSTAADPEDDDQSLPFSYDVPAVKTYENVVEDLKSGYLEVDGNEYIVPDTYSSFSSLCLFDNDLIDKKDRTLSHGDVLVDLPVSFVNADYTGADVSVDIANNSSSDIDISKGTVNGFYIGKKSSSDEKYPRVILPGNVTIGTSKTAIEYIYGNIFKCKKISDMPSCVTEMYDNGEVSVFYMECNNEHNHIYFVFDSSDSLLGVYWSYFDLQQIS